MSQDQDRYLECAEDPEKYQEMVRFLGGAQDKDELTQRSLLFILAPEYPRADICLALKKVEFDKGWRL